MYREKAIKVGLAEADVFAVEWWTHPIVARIDREGELVGTRTQCVQSPSKLYLGTISVHSMTKPSQGAGAAAGAAGAARRTAPC